MITIRITPPHIPSGAAFYHESTSYELSDKEDFSNILDSSYLNTTDLTRYTSDIDIGGNIIFVRSKVHFSDGNASPWSRPLLATDKGTAFTSTTSVVATPKLESAISNRDTGVVDITVNSSPFWQLEGSGYHKSTDWILKTLDGVELWRREGDDINKLSIVISSRYLDDNKAYVLLCRHHSDDQSYSEFGTFHFSTGFEDLNYIYED